MIGDDGGSHLDTDQNKERPRAIQHFIHCNGLRWPRKEMSHYRYSAPLHEWDQDEIEILHFQIDLGLPTKTP